MPFDEIYWLDKWEGGCKGGFFIRCGLFERIKHFEEKGYKVIGIKIEDGWNLEFICEEPKEKKEQEDAKA